MSFLLCMPKLSPTMERGVLAKWHKKEGEFFNAGELIFEVVTDKATVEYHALDEGWLRNVLVHEGEEAAIQDPLAVISQSQEESIEDVLKIKKQTSEQIESSNIDKTISSPISSDRTVSSEKKIFPPAPPVTGNKWFKQFQKRAAIQASPLAKKLAEEKGIDLHSVRGTGPQGRVVSEDLVDIKGGGGSLIFPSSTPSVVPGSYEEIPMSPMRKAIAQRMEMAKGTIPHFYVSQKINVDLLLGVRQELKKMNITHSVNDFIVRATALALRKHPKINRGFYAEHQTLIAFKTVDIAVATSVEDGVITPIIRHADYKNIRMLSLEISELVGRARKGQLEPEEYQGGSFTISNLGMYGITSFQSIINPPQGAALAVGGIDGGVMILTISADHRVVDGVDVAEFLSSLKEFLENPSLLLYQL